MQRRDGGSGQGRRGRTRRLRTGLLITTALIISVATMAGMTAHAVISRASCANRPLLVNLAVSYDMSSAMQTIGRTFNTRDITVGGRCVDVQVTPGQPSAVAAQVDGQETVQGMSPVDAWIPDSSLWVDVARSYAGGAQVVQPTGITVARSPVLLVTTQPVAKATDVFGGPVTWRLLLPPSNGGPPAHMGLTVDLPDPRDSAVGLATVIQISRLVGNTKPGRTAFTNFAYSAISTQEFNSADALTSFAASTVLRRAISVASEQAVISYDRANPSQPLAARYPIGLRSALGSPELDYPYVITATKPPQKQAAAAFGQFLTSPYAQSVLRYNGFRSGSGQPPGTPDTFPAAGGLAAMPLQLATPATASEAATNLSIYRKLGIGSRVLVLTDTSAAMGVPSGLPGMNLEQVLTKTSAQGLVLFPDNAELGLWEIPNGQDQSASYKSLVSIGPLPANYGLFSRRQQIQQVNMAGLQVTNNPLHLYDALLAAYRQMTASYAPDYSNAVVVLTAGIDGPGDMALRSLLSQLKKLYNPAKKIEIIPIQFGQAGNFKALQQVAAATGSAAYQITSPDEIAKIFIEAIAQRLCGTACRT
jgi:Ca-activated chloride channel homolog